MHGFAVTGKRSRLTQILVRLAVETARSQPMVEGMKLDEYVRETLLAIVSGVMQAQANDECGGYIGRATREQKTGESAVDTSGNAVSIVKFDLATTVDARQGGETKGGIRVIPLLSVGGELKAEQSSSMVSRIAFSVTVAIPQPPLQRQEEADRRARNNAAMERNAHGASWMG